jgi:hypothetical protein
LSPVQHLLFYFPEIGYGKAICDYSAVQRA